GAQVVDGAGDDLLAGAALAVDQDGAGALGDGHDLLADAAHRGGGADEAVEAAEAAALAGARVPLAGAAEERVLADEAAVLDGPLDGDDELVPLERLGEVVE